MRLDPHIVTRSRIARAALTVDEIARAILGAELAIPREVAQGALWVPAPTATRAGVFSVSGLAKARARRFLPCARMDPHTQGMLATLRALVGTYGWRARFALIDGTDTLEVQYHAPDVACPACTGRLIVPRELDGRAAGWATSAHPHENAACLACPGTLTLNDQDLEALRDFARGARGWHAEFDEEQDGTPKESTAVG